jgi:hypothetical protein
MSRLKFSGEQMDAVIDELLAKGQKVGEVRGEKLKAKALVEAKDEAKKFVVKLVGRSY